MASIDLLSYQESRVLQTLDCGPSLLGFGECIEVAGVNAQFWSWLQLAARPDPAQSVGSLDRGSGFRPSPALVVKGIWRVSQHMRVLF